MANVHEANHSLSPVRPANHVFRFVLTGGPCGGKSTALLQVAERFRCLGYRVFTLPESSSFCHDAGMLYPGLGSLEDIITWETCKLKLQISLEDRLLEYAASRPGPTVLLCDRGALDTRAYLEAKDFAEVLERAGLSESGLADSRYDAVCHMVTAAIGAENFYTTANNEARRESVDEARELDMRTRFAWMGHRRLSIIGNETGFKDKVLRVISYFCKALDAPQPHAESRRFVVRLQEISVPFVEFTITSVFLLGNVDVVLTKRSDKYGEMMSVSVKELTSDHIIVRAVTKEEAEVLMTQRDPDRAVIHRTRKCFTWGNSYYEYDSWGGDSEEEHSTWINSVRFGHDLGLLIVESDQSELNLPPFVEKVEEILDTYSLKLFT